MRWFFSAGPSPALHRRRRSDIAENLGEIWGVNQVQAAEALMGTLSQSEQESLKSLEDFDFDDI